MQSSYKILIILIVVIIGFFAWFFAREIRSFDQPSATVNRQNVVPVDIYPSSSGGERSAVVYDDPLREKGSGSTPVREGASRGQVIEGSADLSVGKDSIRSALRYEQPILAALEWNIASQEESDTSSLARNAGVWMTICKNENLVSQLRAEEVSDREDLASKLGTFCDGFSEEIEEDIDRFLQTEAGRFSRGGSSHSELMRLSETLGAGAAVDGAIASMPAALERLDYAQVLELVWLTGLLPSISPGPVDPEIRGQLSDDAQVAFAVSASMYCRHIGDCQARHPVVLLLCQQMWPDRQCSAPRDIHDAVDQLLTGAEYEEYLSMINFITARIQRQE